MIDSLHVRAFHGEIEKQAILGAVGKGVTGALFRGAKAVGQSGRAGRGLSKARAALGGKAGRAVGAKRLHRAVGAGTLGLGVAGAGYVGSKATK